MNQITDEIAGDLSERDRAMIDAAWEHHKAAAPVCNCGAATEGRWADKHGSECAIFSRDRESPDWPPRILAEAREIVAAWMIERGYATGHGDTIEDLLSELVTQCRPFPKRPVAFRVANGTGKFVVTLDEREAADIAEIVGVDYDGLYVRKDETASAHSPDDPTDASPSAPVSLNQT